MRTEAKQQIVNAIKELGYNSRQVSVITSSSAFHVTVKDASINPDVVENAVQGFENYQRDEATGEILQGGNTFIFVGVGEEVKKIWAKQYVELVEKAIEQLAEDNHGVKIMDNYFLFQRRPGCYSLSYFGENEVCGNHIGYNGYYSAEGVAVSIHLHKINQEVKKI